MLAPPILTSVLQVDFGLGAELSVSATGSPSSTAWFGGSTALFIPISFDVPGVVTKLWVENGGTASGNIDAGLFSSVSGDVGGKIVTVGGVAQAGTSKLQEFDVTDFLVYPLTNYYFGLVLDNGTGTVGAIGYASVLLSRLSGVRQQATAYPLPSTPTPATVTTSIIPNCGVSFRALVG